MFPEDVFRKPIMQKYNTDDGIVHKPKWQFNEEPLQKKLLAMEAMSSPALQKALHSNLTEDLISSLYYKATQKPPENINIEIKGQTRSGKSTVGITLGILISRWWGHEFTEDNIMPNQGELLYRLKDAKYGETFLVDEQTPETYGEGMLRETEQLGTNLNICAKKCNNLIFIYPPTFTSRNSPFGLEALAKDTTNRYVKCFYYDLRRKEFGGGQIPRGYVLLPKFMDLKYKGMKPEKWSDVRKQNWDEKHYDYDSELEEKYEGKKDLWIEDVRNMDAGIRDKRKTELAESLAIDPQFMGLKGNGRKEAYIQLLINKGRISEMAKTELKTIVDMANVISEVNFDEDGS